jgi:hypothetical protein
MSTKIIESNGPLEICCLAPDGPCEILFSERCALYNDSQPRDKDGKWTSGGGGSGKEDTAKDRAARARATFKPATREKHAIADRMEKALAHGISGKRTADNEAFDVIRGKYAIEVKTVIDAKNNKITMHPSSRNRKLDFAKSKKMEAHTVVIDRREGKAIYYHKSGVGSYRFGSSGTMTKVSMDKLRGLFR